MPGVEIAYWVGMEYQATDLPFLIRNESGAIFNPVNGGYAVFPKILTGKLLGEKADEFETCHFMESNLTG